MMRLVLGPLLYYWPRQRVFDFYDEIAALPVDVVYLGEAVCARRHELRLEDWQALGERLAQAGKEVVFSTLPLIESESDLKAVRRVLAAAQEAGCLAEANEMGAVRMLAESGQAFVAGATLNVFNAETLQLLKEAGARRWVLPPEASEKVLAGILSRKNDALETEVLVHGRAPLAYSARCFTARRFRLQKDACEFRCLDFPEGIPVLTREGQPFLTLNGIQTQSAKVYHLERELPALQALGVTHLRISPAPEATPEIVRAYRRLLEGAPAGMPNGDYCNGFWYEEPGLSWVECAREVA
ncbi:MAG: U32 family peptidase [Rhodocyclaceae bacterium]|nr:U32 family peptidase [Rhodocyclaceae bacterium]